MGKIKGWEKVQKKNTDVFTYFYVKHLVDGWTERLYIFPPLSNKKSWIVSIGTYNLADFSEDEKVRYFPTKQQALVYAIKYMRVNP